jgi:hypothetical protein
VLRKQYEPPKDLPPQMLTLLRQMDETGDDDSWRLTAASPSTASSQRNAETRRHSATDRGSRT